MRKTLLTSFLVALLSVCGVNQVWADLTAIETVSSYSPSQIVNGSFDVHPFMQFTYGGTTYYECNHTLCNVTVTNIVFHGVNDGWNTTDNMVWLGNLFEYYDGSDAHKGDTQNATISGTDKFVEINCAHACMLYQDLTTYSGDIIRWTLKHAVKDGGDNTQPIRVEIGAPNRDGNGKIINASGWATSLNTQMVANTVAKYSYNSITNPSGVTYGYGKNDELQYLRLTKAANSNGWWDCAGVYIIPEGQSTTRFGFISEAATPNLGNLLDGITFSTLLGNLKAVANANGSVTITGYWGDSNSAKKLKVKIGSAEAISVDMTNVINKSFSVEVPAASIGTASDVTVYHEDYPDASKIVQIVKLVTDGAGMEYTPAQEEVNTKLSDWQTASESSTIDVTIVRTILKNGYFNTLCLPFDLTADQIEETFGTYKELKEYVSCTVTGSGDDRELVLNVTDATTITAGKAYLISFENGTDLTKLDFKGVKVTQTTATTASKSGHASFQGILAPYQLPYGNEDYLFLGQQNRLFWPINDGTFMKGFRAYFKVETSSEPSAPVRHGMKASFGSKNTPTDNANVNANANEIKKMIENGRVCIMNNGVKYDMNGNRLE